MSNITFLVSGGIAGVGVDTMLFPLDTLKTRLQSSQGFDKAGGFRGVYKGLSSAAAGIVWEEQNIHTSESGHANTQHVYTRTRLIPHVRSFFRDL